MKIERLHAHYLTNIPVRTPPFRKVPATASAILIEVVTDSGHTGWSRLGGSHPLLAEFFNSYFARELIGENPFEINKVRNRLHRALAMGSIKGGLSSLFRTAWSGADIAIWDLKGQIFGKPVHQLLGGARDSIHVYITFGVPYGKEPEYSQDELVAEAKHWVEEGNTALKTVVGQKVRGQDVNPDSREDFQRLAAVREAVGPDVRIALDGAFGLSLPETIKICRALEDLDIAFLEEPIYDNDPQLLAQLRAHTSIPIAAAETPQYSARHLLTANAIDILQPNVSNDGGYSAGVELAAIARAFNVPIGHGNGAGPYNIALHAGVPNGTEVEYHQHRWFDFNAIFENVPQPRNGSLAVSDAPGTGLVPKDGLIKEFAATP